MYDILNICFKLLIDNEATLWWPEELGHLSDIIKNDHDDLLIALVGLYPRNVWSQGKKLLMHKIVHCVIVINGAENYK